MGHEHAGESWVVMHHQIDGCLPKKKISRTQAHILWGGVPPTIFFSAEILGPNIESAEVLYTKPEDEFSPGIGLHTKSRRDFLSSKVRYTICVVEFRQITLKSAKTVCGRFGGTGSQFSAGFPSGDLMPHNRPQKKQVRRVRRDLFGKQIWDFNAKFWTLDPTLLIGQGHVIGRILPG